MKILITIDFPPEQGGIQRYLYNLVKYSYDSSDNVLVGCGRKSENNHPELPCPVRYYSMFLSRFNKKVTLFYMFFVLLSKIVNNHKKLTIEAGNIYSALPVYLISIFKPVNYMVYCYGKELLPLKKNGWRKMIFSKVLMGAGKIYYLTGHTASLLNGLNLNQKLCYLPPRIDRSILESVNIKSIHDPINLLSVGRLEEHKGHDILVDVVRNLPESIKCKLTIVGSGQKYSSLERKISKYSLNDKVALSGPVSDNQLWLLYQNADIFLFPSKECENGTEGFGIVLLEAMAKGVAIIASRTGGIPEVLENGRCGLLVTPGSIDQWRDGIIQLISNNDLRKRLITNARLSIEKYYVWK